MSERGVFAVDRGIWEHDLLLEDAPFSRREAWLWLVSEAAWKPHRRRLLGRPIELARGQLAASSRFIASKWRWSEARVRRFLAALISERMIDAKTDAGVTVITVCKYDEYQRVSLPSDAMRKDDADAPPTQERRKVEDREYKEDKEKENTGSDEPVRSRPRYSPAFEGWWLAYPRTPVMSKKEAAAAWARLSEDDRLQAVAALSAYRKFLVDKPDHPVVHACRFLSQRRFDGFTTGPPGSAGGYQPPPGAISYVERVKARANGTATGTEIRGDAGLGEDGSDHAEKLRLSG